MIFYWHFIKYNDEAANEFDEKYGNIRHKRS